MIRLQIFACRTIKPAKIHKNIGVSIYTEYKKSALLAEAIYTNSTHQHVIGLVNNTKDGGQWTAPVVWMVKRVV